MNLTIGCHANCNRRNYRSLIWPNKKIIIKTLMIMRLSVIFLLATCLQVSAKGFSQISIKEKNEPLQKVLSKIQKQSGYDFFYAYEIVQNAGTVSLSLKNVSLERAMDECLRGKDLVYEIVEKTVVIKKRAIMPSINLRAIPYKVVLDKIKVEGKVVNDKGEPMAGVSVVIIGTAKGTTTDANGAFSIEAEAGQTIEFSAIGFTKASRKVINGKNIITISLLSEISDLKDVIVVGYGTQKKINLTGAVGSIKSDFIDDRPVTSASQALSGAVSGVFVNQNSGVPGEDGATIKIRGTGTLNNTSPLVLIDGIESTMNNLDPNDIASISVLKDAASAAIYGSRASNGVVLITTKRGSSNRNPSVTYSGYYGTENATRVPSVITNSVQYMELVNTAITNSGNTARYTQAQIDFYKTKGPNTDWVKEIFKSAPIQQHNVTVTGGSPNTSYFLSFGMLNQDAITPITNFKRYNLRLNLDTKIADKLTIGTNLFLVRGIYTSPARDIVGTGGDAGIPVHALQAAPLLPKFDAQGRLAGADQSMTGGFVFNPFAQIIYNSYERFTNQFLGSAFAEYEVIKGLKVKGTLALNYQTTDGASFASKGEQYDWVSGNALVPSINALRGRSKTHNYSNSVTSWLQATYTKTIKNHKIDLLAGVNQESYKFNSFNAFRNNFPVNNVQVLSAGNASTATNGEFATDWALRSFFGRVNYNFSERYLFEFNVRKDGSSRFGADNHYGIFPSVSAGWVISSEKFFVKTDWINLLKMRASWGQLGNQYAGANGANDYPFAAQVSTSSNYVFNGAVVSGAAQTTYNNPNIKWETSTSVNIGADIRLLNKVNIQADYFVRTTNDILYAIPAPATAGGLANPVINTGKVQNKGFEFSADYDDKFGDVAFSIGINFTNVKSQVLYLSNTRTAQDDQVIYGFSVLQRGAPIGSILGYKVAGIFQSADEITNSPKQPGSPKPGDLKYVDLNGDKEINSQDRTIIGHENPEWLYGGNLKVSYKGFDLSTIVQGVSNFQTYGYYELYSPFFNGANLGSQWLDSWTPENTDAKFPKLYVSSGGGPNDAPSNFWLQNRAFFRLKNVQIGYNLPTTALSRIKIQKIRLYANGQNLWTKTKFLGFDPERPDGGVRGGDGYPLLKIFTFGLNVTF